ncbi:uncharacterized protein BO72DRAFT_251004 [Aspergillus fijiensis CBS 313.89]|uniref:C2H2-type domain-containing protein n=1 Tax=Aspergillus fijiensis CBS 313.89 TaxID=1448319 RepID=A0A8G1VUD7_9EURO|nr:uncharacterized protein BO72DRAFT_251004 [Aspergillus fijiensis CBS 313.89]RAK72992.1 hypothetical protein BO72DRAFT_251004 [Aspergillus fijiensis CBS 313.89]
MSDDDESSASGEYHAEYHPHLREAAAYTDDEVTRRAFDVRQVRGADAAGLRCCLPEAQRSYRTPSDQEQCPMCDASCHPNCLDKLRNEEMHRGRPLAYGCPRCGTLWRTDAQTTAAAERQNRANADRTRPTVKPYRYRRDPISGRYVCTFAPPSTGQPCGWTRNTRHQIRVHHNRAHEDNPDPSCDCAGVSVFDTDDEDNISANPPPCPCPICAEQYYCRHAAAAHCRKEHRNNSWPPKCRICHTIFDKYLDLIVHLTYAHQNPRPSQ